MSFAFEDGSFRRLGKWSTLPKGFKDFSKAAAIKLTADGKILMASNRGCDSIAFFAVDGKSGILERRNIAMLKGPFPRDFELMPGEKFMVVGHKRGNEIQIYRFDRAACTLDPVGDPIPCWRPLCFKFLEGRK
jgi:6-phosphogluconolactonase